jgi:hypothetical protein
MIDQRVVSLPPVQAFYFRCKNLPSDTGILLGSCEILHHKDGTTLIGFRQLLAALSLQQQA